jgi:hypothetical protein
MPASEAMPRPRAVAGESAIVLVESNTLPSVFCGKIEGVPYHVSHPIKDERRTSGKGNGALANIRSELMRPAITVPIVQQDCRIESPQYLILSGQFALVGAL